MNSPRRYGNLSTLRREPKASRSGKIGYILMWALGVPIPVLLLFFFLRGCN